MFTAMTAIGWKEGFGKFINLLLYLSSHSGAIINYIVSFFRAYPSIFRGEVNDKLYRFINGSYRLLGATLNDKLYSVNPFGLENYVGQPFPQINWQKLFEGVAYYDIITKSTIKYALVMYDKVKTLFAPSTSRDQYLAILDILLNGDTDADVLIEGKNENHPHVDVNIAGLAYSVMNAKVVKKLRHQRPLTDLSSSFFVTSEVIYDTDLINTNMYDFIYNKLVTSIYLANKASMLYETVRLTTIYNSIEAANNPAKVQYMRDKPEIYDPETALRLIDIVNVKPYLKPITAFSKNLMIQFGLL